MHVHYFVNSMLIIVFNLIGIIFDVFFYNIVKRMKFEFLYVFICFCVSLKMATELLVKAYICTVKIDLHY